MRELRNLALVCLLLFVPQLAGAPRNTWIATWAASPQSAAPNPKQPLLNIEDQTVRERVRVSIGGAQICIRLSNEYGSAPLLIGSATVAAPTDPASVRPGSIQTVTFGGHNSVTIPAGSPVLSDPVAFPVTSGAEISISLYFPTSVATPTLHHLALKRAVVSQHGDHTRAEKIEDGAVSRSSILVSAADCCRASLQKTIFILTMLAIRRWPMQSISLSLNKVTRVARAVFLTEHAFVFGFYGMAVELVMSLIVSPLSALHARGPYELHALFKDCLCTWS